MSASGRVGSENAYRDEISRYRDVCRTIDRLLDQSRLTEALRLNAEARRHFRRLYAGIAG